MSSLHSQPIRLISGEETHGLVAVDTPGASSVSPDWEPLVFSQNMVPDLAELESVGSLLDVQTLWPRSRPPESEHLRVGSVLEPASQVVSVHAEV